MYFSLNIIGEDKIHSFVSQMPFGSKFAYQPINGSWQRISSMVTKQETTFWNGLVLEKIGSLYAKFLFSKSS